MAGPGWPWQGKARRCTARQGKVFDVMNDFITRRELAELVELERRRERRARIRCAVIVALSLVFWGVVLYLWSGR
jgi:predicted nucleic acid-binding Zn ribbon protein